VDNLTQFLEDIRKQAKSDWVEEQEHQRRDRATPKGNRRLTAGMFALNSSSPTPFRVHRVYLALGRGSGILQIVEAIRLRKEISGDVWLTLGGGVTLCFGSIIWLRPFMGLIGLAVAIAGFALLWGIFEILLGKELRSLRQGRVGWWSRAGRGQNAGQAKQAKPGTRINTTSPIRSRAL
jgi:hypothetical protein